MMMLHLMAYTSGNYTQKCIIINLQFLFVSTYRLGYRCRNKMVCPDPLVTDSWGYEVIQMMV